MTRELKRMVTVNKKIKAMSTRSKNQLLGILTDGLLNPQSWHRDDLINELIEAIEIWGDMNLNHFKDPSFQEY